MRKQVLRQDSVGLAASGHRRRSTRLPHIGPPTYLFHQPAPGIDRQRTMQRMDSEHQAVSLMYV